VLQRSFGNSHSFRGFAIDKQKGQAKRGRTSKKGTQLNSDKQKGDAAQFASIELFHFLAIALNWW
jgi:hypothetical protein